MFLWARRVLGWDTTQFSTWSAADEAIHQAGMVIWVGLASYYHFSDHTVATFGLVSIGLWSVVLACIIGQQNWWLVIPATLLGSLEASIEPALRSLITRIPDKSDIGKILALVGFLEAIWLFVDRSIYTALYNACVEQFPQVWSTIKTNYVGRFRLMIDAPFCCNQISFVVQSAVSAVLILAVILLKRDWFQQRRLSPTAADDQEKAD